MEEKLYERVENIGVVQLSRDVVPSYELWVCFKNNFYEKSYKLKSERLMLNSTATHKWLQGLNFVPLEHFMVFDLNSPFQKWSPFRK